MSEKDIKASADPSGSNGSKESHEGEYIEVHHGRKQHRFPLSYSTQTFRNELSRASGVEIDSQRLIIRGKKLEQYDDQPLHALPGIRSGVRCLLMSARPAPAPAPKASAKAELHMGLDRVRRLDKEAQSVEAEVTRLESKLRNKVMGFLDKEKTIYELDKLKIEAKTLEEKCMKILEKLDTISSASNEEQNTEDAATSLQTERTRAERRACVKHTQNILRRLDNLNEDISQSVKDEHGEIASRRGRSHY